MLSIFLYKFYRCAKLRAKDRLPGECDKLRFPLHFSDLAEPLAPEAAPRGEPTAEGLDECGHDDEKLEVLRKESFLIK